MEIEQHDSLILFCRGCVNGVKRAPLYGISASHLKPVSVSVHLGRHLRGRFPLLVLRDFKAPHGAVPNTEARVNRRCMQVGFQTIASGYDLLPQS